MAVVDDGDVRVLVGREEARDGLDRPDRRRQADALRTRTAGLLDEIVEPRERQRQVRAALVVGHRMNLVDDDGLDAAQRLPAALGRQQDEQRLRRRDEDVRRMLHHPLPLGVGVSPVRTAVRMAGSMRPRSAASAAMPASGTSRFF